MASKKKGGIGQWFVWGLLGLLLLGLGGFGATNFSGTVRSIGTVGEAPISTGDYFRALQNEIRNIQQQTGQTLTFQQAQSLGITQQVLSQMVVTAALENEAATLGISVGDDRLARDLLEIRAFQGPDGSFNREAYRMALENAGMSEREFEEKMRDEGASTLLQGAVIAGVRLPDAYVNTLLGYSGERRAFTWAEVSETALEMGLPAPTEEELRAHYDANIDRFTRPETRRITYVWLTPDMLVDSVEVPEDSLRAAYEERSAEFNLPERRLVERLVFNDTAAAQAALDRLTAGEIAFEDLVAERDLSLSDTDLGDVSRSDLGEAADIVFAGEVGAIVGPAPTPLGPALFRVNARLPAQLTSFEEAIPMMRGELALDRARRVIDGQSQGFDDELAAGLTLEELAASTDLEAGEIGWTGDNEDGIAGYPAFREAAEAAETSDYPSIQQLGDGGIFALRLDAVEPPAPYPFDEVRVRVQADWTTARQSAALLEQAEALAGQLGEGVTFEGLGLDPQTEAGLTRSAVTVDLPEGVLNAVFGMEPGGVRAVQSGDRAVIVRLDEILPVDLTNEQSQQLATFVRNQAAQDVAQDLFRALSTDIQARAGVNIDQAAVNAVHANFQ
ncbi:peptidyl-prolyl cis-trans isomerase [Maliponia aquimaris]|uniref:Parvulin-like PPIase n=1 Tax=Maliponia aquimaris TaxID=1673631 RepID=A0A238L882_9RHOB|nr:peptidyl-prolyl cis-trans isomerase [Maliponia aquimaris]SMX50582.1 Peptidyl-prolyl cis-trans isomerase D [Maliponia aquimaris]